MRIELVQGDITTEVVDAIVTAANESLLGGGGVGEADTLASCYRRVLEVADEIGAETVAIPAIATGVYGYPIDAAADIAVHTLRTTPTRVALVRLVAFDEDNYHALEARLGSTARLPAE